MDAMRARGLLLPLGLALLAACAEAPPRSGESVPDAVKASPAEAAIVSAIAAHRQQAERDATRRRSRRGGARVAGPDAARSG